MGFSCFRGRRPRYAFPFVPNRELQVGLTVLTLSLTLSHGERERITEIMFAEMMANGMRFSVFTGKAHATTSYRAEQGTSGGFDCFCPLPSPLPRGEGTNCRELQQWLDFSHPIPSLRGKENKLQGIATIVEFQLSDSLSPWERVRERVKQSNPPEALCSAR